MFNVTAADRADANELMDIDIKCLENPWCPEMWAKVVCDSGKYGIVVGKFHGTPVGFAVYVNDVATSSVQILKVCVKRQMRRKGVSLRLLKTVFKHAVAGKYAEVAIIIRESTVYPGTANVSRYLTHLGFVPTKPFIKSHFQSFGEPEDGVKFVAPASTIIPEAL